ncbi:MAG: DUF4270 domain-containing protein [Urechidicola sp.]|nr:DUF4270 domain-containing protein [Urechidicola sp.]
MTTKVVNVLKQGGISLFIILGLLACEGPIDNVGVNIVDNDVFEDGKYTSEVVTYNKNIEKRLANKLDQYLLGVYKNDDFGQIDASVIAQLTFNTDIDFGVNPSIDTVILNIPYYATRDGNDEDGFPNFVLDSIIGNQEVVFNLKISELQTYLNTLDPLNPSEELDYFTDDNYTVNMTPLYYNEEFKPNEIDTVLYVNRPEIISDPENDIYSVDTIKRVDAMPTIKVPLDEDFFTNNFLNNPAVFESTSAFIEFFNGLYIEASPGANPEASLMTLDFSAATMTIYYTNTEFEKRTKQTATFLFGSVTNNKYTRDYSGSIAEPIINNPDEVFGDDQLFVQGAAGSIALLDLFTEDNLAELRSNNWLINDANLIFYIDQTADLSIVPDRLLLYNYDDGNHLTDFLFEGFSSFGGGIEYDDDEDNPTPILYKINITDYVSKILAFEDAIEPSKLALKVFNNSDFPLDLADFEVDDYSWNPKGIILHGNNTTDIEKRVKLEITYTEINN